MGATPIDNNDADGKSGKLYGWLLIIRCTRDEQHKREPQSDSPTQTDFNYKITFYHCDLHNLSILPCI